MLGACIPGLVNVSDVLKIKILFRRELRRDARKGWGWECEQLKCL